MSETTLSVSNQALPGAVKRVWVVGGTPTQEGTRLLYSSKPARRKVSKMWRPADKFLRQFAEAQSKFSSEYLGRHEASASKKKDGAVRDLVKNVSKARKAGGKSIRWKKIFNI